MKKNLTPIFFGLFFFWIAFAQAQTSTFTGAGFTTPISGTNSGTINVVGLPTFMSRVTVKLTGLSMSYEAIMQAYIKSPTGKYISLFSRNGNIAPFSGDLILDQNSSNILPGVYGGTYTPGTYKPGLANAGAGLPAGITANLDDLRGDNPNGIWELHIIDLLGAAVPTTLTSWSLTISSIPYITSFAPSNGPVGTSVILTGAGFNATAANNIVFFGATKAIVSAGNTENLMVTVPSGATHAPITVLNTSNHLITASKKFFLPTYTPIKTSFTALDFTGKVDFTTANDPQSIAVGDLDGDGKPDAVVANANSVAIFKNMGTPGDVNFAAKLDLNTGAIPFSVTLVDIDGDGKLDIATANNTGNTISVLRNTSSGGLITFAAKTDFATGTKPQAIIAGDFDGDGKMDLAVSNTTTNTISILKNASSVGTINFAPSIGLATDSAPFGLASGDLDGDGRADLAVTNSGANSVSVFLNRGVPGNISFLSRVNYTTGGTPFGIAIGDIDSDGKQDIAVSSFSGNYLSVLKNNSAGGTLTIAAKVDFATGTGTGAVAIGDVNGDGKPDIVTANGIANSISLLRNIGTVGNLNLAAKLDFATGNLPTEIVVADMNGDGRPDLLTSNGTGDNFSVLRNVLPPPVITSFSPLSANAGVTVTIVGDRFNPAAAKNIVYFGPVRATVNMANATNLTVTVSTGALHGPITVLNTDIDLMATSADFFLPTFPPVKVAITPSDFDPKKDFPVNIGVGELKAGDFNNDGKPDLIQVSDGELAILPNTGTQGNVNFGSKVGLPIGFVIGGVASADFDGDGLLDIAAINSTFHANVLRNTTASPATITFAAAVDLSSPQVARNLSVADVDGDGRPDIITTNYTSNNVIAVYLNTGSPGIVSFAPIVTFATGNSPRIMSIGDLDNDGKPDVAVATGNSGSTSISLLRNISSSGYINFAPKTDLSLPGAAQSIAMGDFDIDGKLDLVVASGEVDRVVVLRNTGSAGNLSFAPVVDLPQPANNQSVSIGDLNGDGKPDLTLIGQTTNVSIFRNTGGAGVVSFTTAVNLPGEAQFGNTVVVDVDGDGKADIARANGNENTISVYRNNSINTTVTSATYNGTTGTLIVTGTAFQSLAGAANDVKVNTLTLTGEGGATYTLTSANVELTNTTSFTVTLNPGDKNAITRILNKNGTTSTSGTSYNLSAAADWMANVAGNADLTGNVVTVNNVPIPNITSANYDATSGSLVITGTGFKNLNGANNDVDAVKFMIKGQGNVTYTLTTTPNVEISSSTSFTLTLAVADRTMVNGLLNKNGASSVDGVTYNLASAEDWAKGADAVSVTADLINPITVDGVPPKIISVTATNANGSYKIGDVITVTITFDQAVIVNAAVPRLLLETGAVDRNINYSTGSGTNTLSFNYTVQTGDLSADLNYATVNALTLNGATIRNVDGLNANLILPPLADANSLSGQKNMVIDGVIPQITSVGVPANATYKAGQNLNFTVNYSEAVSVNTTGGTPRIAVTLDNGGTVYATYQNGSGSSTLTFSLTVTNGQQDANGITLANTIDLNGGLIYDAATNNAAILFNSVGSTTGVRIDAILPAIVSINRVEASPTNSTSLAYLVTFSENVTGVDLGDFNLTTTGTVSGALLSVNAQNASTYMVMINSVIGDGTLRLNLNNSGTGIIDQAGNAITTGFAGEVYILDQTTPNTTLTSTPPVTTNSTNATFAFVSTQPGTFEVSLDGAAFAPGTTPLSFSGLTQGTHTFAVRAKDNVNNIDATPATYSWTIDSTAPVAPVVVAPTNGSTLVTLAPTISGTSEPNIQITVYIDNTARGTVTADAGGNWAYTPSPLSQGLHAVYVRGFDAALNISPNSNSNRFTLNLLSSNADLTALILNDGVANVTLSPSFSSSTLSYAANVNTTVANVTLKPTASDANAIIKVNGITVISGAVSSNIPINLGVNTITTEVTSQDGATTKIYTITVNRSSSANADLANLTLSAGILSPVFAAGTTTYGASVSNATNSITVTPILADASGSLTVNGAVVASGDASSAILLSIGANTITVEVTAQDGITTKIYTVTVNRLSSANADLANLTLSEGVLAPVFAAGTTAYTTSVGNTTSSITLTPTLADANATLTVNGLTLASGDASQLILLNFGANTITTVVTAQDGVTTKTYTVTVNRIPSTNADLADLVLSAGTLSPVFAAGSTAYTASVGNATSSITVRPTLADADATLKVNGLSVISGAVSQSIVLNVGPNTITVLVTAQDGVTTKSYTVIITRALSTQAITFEGTATTTYGDSDFDPGAISTNTTIPIIYSSSNPAVATIVNGNIHIASAGTTIITASQAGDGVYAPTSADQLLTVNAKGLIITANQKNKTYGQAVVNTASSTEFTAIGLVGSESISNVSITYGSGAAALAAVNTYSGATIAAAAIGANGFVASNYMITYVPGNIVVSKAQLTITADAKNKVQNTANPPLTASYSGFVNGETAAVLSTQPNLITTALQNSPVGQYPITIGGAAAVNYVISYVDGILTVTPGAVTAIALVPVALYENQAIGTVAGNLSSSSPDPGATFTYTLVSGTGSADNASFSIVGSQLRTAASLDFEAKSSYSVLIRSITQSGQSMDKTFIISLNDVNEQPSMAVIANQLLCATTAPQTVGLTGINAGPETPQTLTVTATSNNATLFDNLGVVYTSGNTAVLNYTIKNGQLGTATITVTVKDNGGTANGGNDSFSRTFTISINPLPVISITSNLGNQPTRGATLTLTATGGSSYVWADAEGIIGSKNTSVLTARPIKTTTYRVTATNTNGCSTSQEITIQPLEEYNLTANNVLTPNSDGKNDLLVFANLDLYPDNNLRIFDRAGRLIYQTTNYQNNWNGFLNGSALTEDTYYYLLDIASGKFVKKGFITIVRSK